MLLSVSTVLLIAIAVGMEFLSEDLAIPNPIEVVL